MTAIVVVVAAAGPLVLIQTRIDRRRAAFEEQLPDVY
jgi:Flp pilus assembly protein TadB